jgi:hypothetical protein
LQWHDGTISNKVPKQTGEDVAVTTKKYEETRSQEFQNK